MDVVDQLSVFFWSALVDSVIANKEENFGIRFLSSNSFYFAQFIYIPDIDNTLY